MHRVCSFLSDPGLHLLAFFAVLIVLAIGSAGSQELREGSRLVHCPRCRATHFPEQVSSCASYARLAQTRP